MNVVYFLCNFFFFLRESITLQSLSVIHFLIEVKIKMVKYFTGSWICCFLLCYNKLTGLFFSLFGGFSDGKLDIVVPSFVHYLEVLEGSDGDKMPGMFVLDQFHFCCELKDLILAIMYN